MLFMLLGPMLGNIHAMEGNLKHLAHEPWPQTCGRIILKFYKNQTKTENYKFCPSIMISYVEAVGKSIEDFEQVVMYAPYKSKYLRRRFLELRSSRSDFELK